MTALDREFKTVEARYAVVLATVSDPLIPAIAGLWDAKPWTNREATSIKEVPRRPLSTGQSGAGSYDVADNGAVTAPSPLGSTLIENNPKSSPDEEGVSAGQNYLYILAQGLSRTVGYRAGADESVTQVTAVPVATGSFGVGAH